MLEPDSEQPDRPGRPPAAGEPMLSVHAAGLRFPSDESPSYEFFWSHQPNCHAALVISCSIPEMQIPWRWPEAGMTAPSDVVAVVAGGR